MTLSEISDDKARVLLLAIQSLEGAIAVLEQTPPTVLNELKAELTATRSSSKEKMPERSLTAIQAAKLLGCSPRYVRLLAERGAITLLRAGGRGRGNASCYDAESIHRWAVERRQPVGASDEGLVASIGGEL